MAAMVTPAVLKFLHHSTPHRHHANHATMPPQSAQRTTFTLKCRESVRNTRHDTGSAMRLARRA